MAEYYGVVRTPEYLAHYGVRGMKWGIRKAIQQTGSHLRPRSKAYTDAQKKLQRATMAGGIIGGAVYAHRHKDELNKSFGKSSKKPRGVRIAVGNKAYMQALRNGTTPKSKPVGIGIAAGNKPYIDSVKSRSPRKLYKEAMAAGKQVENARNNLSALGRHGFGKTAKAYRDANIAARQATNAYYNSLSKKEYAKLRRKHVG